ncbi:hypothetical protein GN958_ATG16101 [Phytophthora infestans]|uniref:Uncharacterized protein n=1 Tax=Phytophthora infestans TaxID=4787 RepID=A0A8S9U182_PHYIN|nr:hypothetical protein GN958_ATG16101 [Phytophthora infestans]
MVFFESEDVYSSIRPINSVSNSGTLLEFCTRLIPVSYLPASTNERAAKDFQQMIEHSISEDTVDITHKLGNRLHTDFVAMSSLDVLAPSLH